MSEATTVAERIREEREWLRYTRAQAAQAINVPEAVIEDFETGARTPSDSDLDRLSRLFGLAPGRLLGEPLAEDPRAAILCGRNPTDADRHQVHRFAEFLKYAGAAPTITRKEPHQ